MKKYLLTFVTVLFLSCSAFNEKTELLACSYYIQDGWLAFSSADYDEAEELFNTPCQPSNDPFYQFLSHIGLGWTHTYKANSILYTEENDNKDSLRLLAGEDYQNAWDIIPDLNIDLMSSDLQVQFQDSEMSLYAGQSFHYFYLAKKAHENDGSWDNAEDLYQQALSMSETLMNMDSGFIFPFDTSLDYNDIYLLRAQIHFVLNQPGEAITEFMESDYECVDELNSDTIMGCLIYLGCTDPEAINFDPEAKTNDLSCQYDDSSS